MNKKLFTLLSGVAIITSASLQSCADEFDPQVVTAQDQRLQEFAANFVKEFGTPDPNHTWGFGMTPELADAILAGHTSGNAKTRAAGEAEGAINTNVNQWTDNSQNALKRVVHVPGWPNDDGRYYVNTGTYNTNGTYDRYNTESEAIGKGNVQGDVTEYEIQWVSRWVRNTGASITDYSTQLHVSEFFIQQVSTDYDYNNYNFDNNTYNADNIHKYGTDNSTQYQMDKLDFETVSGNWTHINDFNAYDNLAPEKTENIAKNSKRNIKYVMSSGTESMQYYSSNSTGHTFKKYVLVKLKWTEPKNPDWSKVTNGTYTLNQVLNNPSLLDNETFEREGYYICFDYQCIKGTDYEYKGDDTYSNWILKLTPGRFKPMGRWPKRIMCEDLGNTNDFDFNDAVFDLVFQKSTNSSNYYDCVVTLQAAGGTMPIVVAVDPNNWVGTNMEIHSLLGNHEVATPVNVIQGGAKAPAAQYRIKNCFEYTGNDNDYLLKLMAAYAFKMNIYVENGGDWESVSGYNLSKGLRAPGDQGYNDGNKGRSNYPQLFNCSSDAKWTYENGHIKDAYTHFIDWVHEEQCDYRLRWDKEGYYKRGKTESDLPTIENHTSEKINSWLGSWDFGPKDATEWGTAWINKSKCYGGNGAE